MLFRSVLVVASTLVLAGIAHAQTASESTRVKFEGFEGEVLPRGFPTSAGGSESYIRAKLGSGGNKGKLALFWLRGKVASKVLMEDDEPFIGDFIRLQENSTRVFAFRKLDSRLRGAYVLKEGRALPVKTSDDKLLAAEDFKVYGPQPEYIQVRDELEVYRLEGTTAVPLKIPAISPKVRYPGLVVTPTGTYLHERSSILAPKRLWLMRPDGTLSRVRWTNGEPAGLGMALFLNAGDATYVVMNDYESQVDPKAEYVDRWLCKLEGDRLGRTVDGEGDLFEAPSLFTNAVVDDRIYLPGWVRANDRLHIWTAREGGEFTLIKSGDAPLSGADIDVYNAGDRLLIRRVPDEDGEPETWVCTGESAARVTTEDGKPLLGKSSGRFQGKLRLLAVEYEPEKHRLYSLDSDLVARPVLMPDGDEPIEGVPETLFHGIRLFLAKGGAYCATENGESRALYFISASGKD